MKALVITNEYPPYVYGGAGIHVEHLTRELKKLMDVEVRCFGNQKQRTSHLTVRGFKDPTHRIHGFSRELLSTLATIYRGCDISAFDVQADLVHCHTWYSHLAGILIKLLYGIPLVVTVHSLEPLRPWKAEQLGRGYQYSSWIERTALEMADAVIAVSASTKKDLLKHFRISPSKISVIHNGIDLNIYKKTRARTTLDRLKIPAGIPYVLFVGRITRQKGISEFIDTARQLSPEIGIVLCATAPDTPEINHEVTVKIRKLSRTRNHVYWIKDMLSKDDLSQLYSHATVFCCPSIYEPFGIINLEAMACETPVVAGRVGGIVEAVKHGETGILVPFDAHKRKKFSDSLARAMETLYRNPGMRHRMGRMGRKRVETLFSWEKISRETYRLYRRILKTR